MTEGIRDFLMLMAHSDSILWNIIRYFVMPLIGPTVAALTFFVGWRYTKSQDEKKNRELGEENQRLNCKKTEVEKRLSKERIRHLVKLIVEAQKEYRDIVQDIQSYKKYLSNNTLDLKALSTRTWVYISSLSKQNTENLLSDLRKIGHDDVYPVLIESIHYLGGLEKPLKI